MDIESFFSQLPPISDWMEIGSPQAYRDIPEGWWVLMTDIKGSTAAIQAGNYKQVNVLGVCAIIAVQNALSKNQFPFIFGGDGATILLPENFKDKALSALSFTRKIAKDQFGYDLRVFSCPVKTLREKGKNISVARLETKEKQNTYLFRGGGISFAEEMMKKDSSRELPADFPVMGGHEGLECRWNPVPSKRGSILALIIKPLDENNAVEALLFSLQELLLKAKPIRAQAVPAAWPWRSLLNEKRALNKNFYDYVKSALWTLLLSPWIRWGRKIKDSNVEKYLNELENNNDYIKRDDSLRLVLDVTPTEKEKIFADLNKFRERGLIEFGYHESHEALLTCMVRSLDNHFHFIDGNHGGYVKAAEMLKRKLV